MLEKKRSKKRKYSDEECADWLVMDLALTGTLISEYIKRKKKRVRGE